MPAISKQQDRRYRPRCMPLTQDNWRTPSVRIKPTFPPHLLELQEPIQRILNRQRPMPFAPDRIEAAPVSRGQLLRASMFSWEGRATPVKTEQGEND